MRFYGLRWLALPRSGELRIAPCRSASVPKFAAGPPQDDRPLRRAARSAFRGEHTSRGRKAGCGLAIAALFQCGIAVAAPEECLILKDNAAVAACANRYAPGTFVVGPKPVQTRVQVPGQHYRVDERGLLVAVPVPVPGSRTPAPAPTREQPNGLTSLYMETDRNTLINSAVIGGAAATMLLLFVGAWRWRASLAKTCPYCGAKVGRHTSICRKCFRAV